MNQGDRKERGIADRATKTSKDKTFGFGKCASVGPSRPNPAHYPTICPCVFIIILAIYVREITFLGMREKGHCFQGQSLRGDRDRHVKANL